MAQGLTVREGQRYADIPDFLSNSLVWEVVSVYQTATRIPHARLVSTRQRRGLTRLGSGPITGIPSTAVS